MAMSLALKRPAEDLLDSSFHGVSDSAIGSSHIRMLSDASQPRGAKRRKDDFPSFIRPSANVFDAGEESDSGASVGEYSDNLDDHVLSTPTKRPADHGLSFEATEGHPSFPCIWLNGNSPTRDPEEVDRAPESVKPVGQPAAVPVEQESVENNLKPHREEPVRREELHHQQESMTPPPPLEPLPKGTVIIQPSQPTEGETLPPTHSPSLYKRGSPGHIKDQRHRQFTSGSPATNPHTPSGLTPQKHISGLFLSNNHHGSSDSEISMDMQGNNVDADGNSMEVCPECNKVFKRKVYLQRHMEREHWSTAKVFKCEDCAYETKHQSNLSVHRRTHTGERPYHCGACGQRYTQGHLLKSHIRSRHGGNMELYNLEKKSESTRGRKSLDMKHENLLGIGGHHKQDKISALLQAAAANNAGALGQPGQQLPPLAKFGGGLMNAPYMNSLPYFNTLRPMMGNPLSLTGGLLANPRFFNMGGLTSPGSGFGQSANALMQSMNSPLAMMTAQNCLSSSSASENLKKTIEAMDMKPKINSMSLMNNQHSPGSRSIGGLHVPVKLPEMPSVQAPTSKAASVPQLSPQDLTTKKSPAEADVPEHFSTTNKQLTSTDPALCEPQDLSNPRYGLTSGASPARPQESDSATIPSPIHPEDSVKYTHKKLNRESYKSGRSHLLNSEDDMGNSEEEELIKDSSPRTKRYGHSGHRCDGESCPNLKKLKDLRRNVFRMLSVFTPDLSFENGISSETDDVDELLYEVIYTNIEEENGANKEFAKE